MLSVYTLGERCKKCYSCVRMCPTKALIVRNGQAEIIEEKCISCGYCVTVCTQNAKKVRSSSGEVDDLFASGRAVYAMLAPSFPASYLEVSALQLVGALKTYGFMGVFEVAFGADLVSYAYYRQFKDVLSQDSSRFFISSPCPAVVSYVEKVFPELTPYLAGIVSPMEAMARVIREKIDPGAAIVFIGPCVAKKDEKERMNLVDEVLTFAELDEMLAQRKIDPASCPSADFEPPHANLGRIYPLTGGLLKAAMIDADLMESPVYVVEGQERVTEILRVLVKRVGQKQQVVNRFFDLLFCEGCIGGPFMNNELSFYERKKYIVEYIKSRPVINDINEWARLNAAYLDINLAKSFTPRAQQGVEPSEEEIQKILQATGKFTREDELNCRACGYSSCREKASAVFHGIAEEEMCLPYLITKLERTLGEFKSNQTRLIQAEKLASMGQMAAGIAHEINNPLGVVLMYSHLLKDELKQTQAQEDVDKIIREAERTRTIVRRILNFAREEKIDRVDVDINKMLSEIAKQRAIEYPDIKFELRLSGALTKEKVDETQIKQVFDNIIQNAIDALKGQGTITLTSARGEISFSVTIADNGPGIPEEDLPKLFAPFFTTKPVGKGTGLGLAVCYGIVKMHGGSITAGNNPQRGAYFRIEINRVS